MKLNKTFGRIATTLVATAMLASVAVVPAFADSFTDGSIDKGTSRLETLTFTKELIRPTVVDTPDVTFTFTMTGQRGGEEVTDTATPTPHKVVTEDAYVDADTPMTATGSVVFGNDDDGTGTTTIEGATCVTDTVDIDIKDLHFSAPGVYKFSLTEVCSDSSSAYQLGITAQNPYSVYVFVQDIDGTGIIATGAELVKGNNATNDPEMKADKITNYYMTTPTGVTPNSVTVDKTVTGTMGDKNNPFAFTVTIVAEGNRTFSASQGDAALTVSPVQGVPNTYAVSTTLKNDESFVINGLLDGDKYTVNETAADQDGYATTVTGDATANNVQVTFDDSAADAVHYQNERNAVSPTGIVMNVAPYALLVVVAAAGCFVFMRKRRED